MPFWVSKTTPWVSESPQWIAESLSAVLLAPTVFSGKIDFPPTAQNVGATVLTPTLQPGPRTELATIFSDTVVLLTPSVSYSAVPHIRVLRVVPRYAISLLRVADGEENG